MLYDKNNVNGISQDENDLLGVDLAVIEKYDGKYQAILWGDSKNEDCTHKIEYKIESK